MFCKNSTNLSFVEQPFSYNIHPKYFLLVIADNNVNFLNTKLIENNVEIIEFIEYDKLAKYYNQSKLYYVPCTIHGGGERSILEARSCGITIKVEDDNPKLKELTKSELYSSKYYAK